MDGLCGKHANKHNILQTMHELRKENKMELEYTITIIVFGMLVAIVLLLSGCTLQDEYTFDKDHCVTKVEPNHNTTICMKSTNATTDKWIVDEFNKIR